MKSVGSSYEANQTRESPGSNYVPNGVLYSLRCWSVQNFEILKSSPQTSSLIHLSFYDKVRCEEVTVGSRRRNIGRVYHET